MNRRNLLYILALGLVTTKTKAEIPENTEIRFTNKTIVPRAYEKGVITDWTERCGQTLTYYYKGEIHNSFGPAVIVYGEQGGTTMEAWFERGKFIKGQSYKPVI